MTTASSLFGATALNFMPGGVSGGPAGEVGVATGCSPPPHAASSEPAPTANTAMPPACSIERRETAFAMSPKYSLSLVLRTGLEHASPHLKRHVTCCRLDFPSWVTNRFNGTSAMGAGPSDTNSGRGLPAGRAEIYVSLAINWEAIGKQLRTLGVQHSAQNVDKRLRLVALHRMSRVRDDVGPLKSGCA